ncbi:hypothetical protein EV359DRAFT_66142 [Lentinula novae-zelandiae]|nr:hypothetical protein EV359DRAFT_66142 [Lentinula novae-zelandiae]
MYQADGGRKSRQDAESKKVESEEKIQLLPLARKQYKNLHVLDDALAKEEEEPNRWNCWNEDFEIAVDKASEVEIGVYDKQVGGTHAVPIALRRQKVFMESRQGGWVTAGDMHGDAGHPNSADLNTPLSLGTAPPGGFGPQGSMGDGIPQQPSKGIESWFADEPAGAILLHLELW